MRFATYGMTDRGRARSRNEDSLLVDDLHRIYAVADGLGGLPKGALASTLAIRTLEELIGAHNNIEGRYEQIFEAINLRVFEEGRKVSEEIGIGTTLTVVKVREGKLVIGHVGDCSVFLFRRGTWQQVTTDHTMEQELRSRLKPGENPYIPEYFAHTLTRCIGQQPTVKADQYHVAIEEGDRVLICSDGVTKTLSDDELSTLGAEAASPEQFVRTIINLGNERGGPDNITAIALFFT